MSEYHLEDTTYAQGISEILPDFVLFEPTTIHIHMFNGYCPSNPDIPAITVQSMDPIYHYSYSYVQWLLSLKSRYPGNNCTIYGSNESNVYLEILEVKDSTINDKRTGISFECIIY